MICARRLSRITNRRSNWFALPPILIFSAVVCFAQSPLTPRHAIFAPQDGWVYLSPDGEWLALGRSQLGVPGVERVERVNGSGDAHPVKVATKGLTQSIRWAADSRHLLFEKRVGNANRVIALEIESGEERDLTQRFERPLGIEAVSASTPNEVLIRTATDTHEIWRVHLGTGESSLVTKADANERIFYDGELRPRVVERTVDEFTQELYVLDDGERKVLRRWAWDDSSERPQAIAVSGDEKKLFVTDAVGRDAAALVAIDLATNTETVLAKDSADIRNEVLFDRKSGEPLLCFSEFEKRRYWFLDESLRTDVAYLGKHFGTQVQVVDWSVDRKAWLVVPLDGGPDRYHVYAPSRREVRPVMSAYSAMEGYALGTRSSHVVRTRDGVELPCHLYLPAGRDPDGDGVPDKPLPLVVFVHGGPSQLMEWDGWNGRSVRCQQLIANRSYAALRVEFRGAGGLGNEVRQAGQGDWGGKPIDDIADAVRWAIEKDVADAERVGIWGFSYGGYATLMALARYPELFACGMSWSGPTSLAASADAAGEGTEGDIIRRRIGADGTAESETHLRAQSPVYQVGTIFAPMLLVHGGNDESVPYAEQIGSFVERLNAEGKSFTLALFPRENHSFSQAASWRSLWAITERFFAAHLGGQYEPYGDNLKRGVEIVAGIDRIPELSEAFN